MKKFWPKLLVFSVALLVRLTDWHISIPFADMQWYFDAAHIALISGRLPMLGIPASINWLHQGPLWTYLLMLPQALGLDPTVLSILASSLACFVASVELGILPGIILALLPLEVMQGQLPYHTSVISLLFFVSLYLIRRGKSYLSGLFVGFLYISHLLTFVYWPIFFYLAYKKHLNFSRVAVGFCLGILPLAIAGPIQLLGIFVWLAKEVLTKFSGVSGGVSTAYWVVLTPLMLTLVTWVLKWIYAHRSGFDT